MKIVICGEERDGKLCERLLRDAAEKQKTDIEVLRVTTGKQLLFYMNSQAADVDLVYIDYDLVDNNGIEIVKELRKRMAQMDVVVCADDNAHAIEGYDVDALYYMVKNKIKRDKFEEVFIKAINRASLREKQYLSLLCFGEVRRIDISSIQYFEIKNRIVTVHYGDNECFAFYSALCKLEETLRNKGFERIHQAFLVSEKYIQKMNKNSVILLDGTELPVGRSYRGKALRANNSDISV